MRYPLIFVLFLVSGASGLIYELVWVRELTLVFGGTTHAITTVLVAFMAGLGLGSYAVGRIAHRLRQPARVFGAIEIAVGLYAVCVPLLLSLAVPAYRALYGQFGDQPLVLTMCRFLLSVPVMLLPATLMGATLPVLVRYATLSGGPLGAAVGRLYGINTLGAVVGTSLAGFVLLPSIGLTHTTWLAAGMDVAVGALALAFLRVRTTTPGAAARDAQDPRAARPTRKTAPAEARAAARPAEAPAPLNPWTRRGVLVAYAVSGFAAMVYQIMWTRALLMSLGSSTYSFTCILAPFILGLALGSLAISRWVDRWRNPVLVFGVLELAIGLVAVLIAPLYGVIPYAIEHLVRAYNQQYDTLLTWHFCLAMAVTFLPTFLMGAIFPIVARLLARRADGAAEATGTAYGVNTIGTILGSFLGGFVLIRSDVLGVQYSIVLASVLNALAGVWLVLLATGATAARRPRPARIAALAGLAGVLAVGLGAGRWDTLTLSAGAFLNRQQDSIASFRASARVLYFAEGPDLTVTVNDIVSDPQALTMRVNGKPDASTLVEDMVDFMLLGHLPRLIGPEGRSACIIGLGAGLTLGAVTADPAFERIDCVEISHEVIGAAKFFEPYTRYGVRDPRVHVIPGDGRNHLLLTQQTYDLIISQPPNPWLAGVSNLFTREFFEESRARLAPHGVFAVWLQSYSMSRRDVYMVIHTLAETFPHVSLWELSKGNFMLCGTAEPLRIELDQFLRRFNVPAVRVDLLRIAVDRPEALLGHFVAADEPLRRLVASAPVHTDDNALLEFSAPRHLYASEGAEIGTELMAIQEPVSARLITTDGRALAPEFVRAVDAVVDSRWAPVRCRARYGEDLRNEGVMFLIDAARRDPTNLGLRELLGGLVAGSPRNDPSTIPVWRALQELPAPLVAPRVGATPELAADLLRRRAADHRARRAYVDALRDLDDARQLAPADPNVPADYKLTLLLAEHNPELAAALQLRLAQTPPDGLAHYVAAVLAARRNDATAVLAELRVALDSGATTAAEIGGDAAFAALRDNAEFKALLARAEATTAPAATQSSP